MDKQAREAREQMKALAPREKWSNFWYYYRVHMLVVLFAVVVLAITVTECVNRVDYDLNISYYSATPISDTAVDALKEYLKEGIDDINGNGSLDVGVSSCFANPNEQSEQTQAVMVKLSAEVAAGDSMVYLFDEEYKELFVKAYEEVAESVIDISDIPEVREKLELDEGEKLFWVTKTVYETEEGKPEKIAEHENALKAQMLIAGDSAKSGAEK